MEHYVDTPGPRGKHHLVHMLGARCGLLFGRSLCDGKLPGNQEFLRGELLRDDMDAVLDPGVSSSSRALREQINKRILPHGSNTQDERDSRKHGL